jgi:hypothetical protein
MRAYIVGNGKSLTAGDLDLIVGQPSFACNRINLIYGKTKWRPTVYVHPESFAPDMEYIQENIDLGIKCYLGEYFALPPKGVLTLPDAENITWLNDCHHHLINFDDQECIDEWHMPQPCTFGGSVNVAMQVAVLLGYDDLILLGCDLEYRDHKPSHFDPAYEHGGELPAWFGIRNALWGHVTALNWIRRHNPKIWVRNATRGGLLEIWPRVKLEDVCAESG